MKGFVAFMGAASPWIAMGLLLAVFLASHAGREEEKGQTRLPPRRTRTDFTRPAKLGSLSQNPI